MNVMESSVHPPPRVIHTLAFGRENGAGSSAAVVMEANGMTSSGMQAVAAMQLQETTFVLTPDKRNAPWGMRFFLREREIPMCVHGTIGAVAALAKSNPLLPHRVNIDTGIGVIAVDWLASGEGAFVCVDQLAPEFGSPIDASEAIPLLRALGVDTTVVDWSAGPVQRVSVSRPKLLVPLADVATLDALRPNTEQIDRVCGEFGATGIYAFTCQARANDRDVDARQFPAGAGFVEDPATGVAAAALAAYLKLHGSISPAVRPSESIFRVRIAQGDALGCPCRLEATAITHQGAVVKTRVCGFGSAAL